MHKLAILAAITALFLAACQPADDDPLPTLAVLPSATHTLTPTETHTAIPVSNTPEPTATETLIPTETNTPTLAATDTPSFTPTQTYTPSITPIPSETPDATRAFITTATAQVIEVPRFATFTPPPPGAIGIIRPTSTGTPEVAADVIITETQFQEEINRILANESAISRARVDFIDGGSMVVELTALEGAVFVTGTFGINFDISEGGFNNVLIARPVPPEQFEMATGGQPSEAFIEIAFGTVTPAVFDAFDFILRQRMGEGDAQRNVEGISFTGTQMNILLIVPDPGQ